MGADSHLKCTLLIGSRNEPIRSCAARTGKEISHDLTQTVAPPRCSVPSCLSSKMETTLARQPTQTAAQRISVGSEQECGFWVPVIDRIPNIHEKICPQPLPPRNSHLSTLPASLRADRRSA